MCLVCTLGEEHGGHKSAALVRVDFWNINTMMTLGYLQRWRDKKGHPWWVAMAGEDGWTPVPLTVRSQAFRKVRGDVVIPLFGSKADAEHALRSSFELVSEHE